MKQTGILIFWTVLAYVYCQCPDEWSQYKDSCYLDSTSDAYSWLEAQNECKGKGGYLAEIENQDENDFIARMTFGAGNWFYMGIVHTQQCEDHVTASDHKKLNYTNWNLDEKNKSKRPSCSLMGYLGYWETVACDEEQYFICEGEEYISSRGFGYPTNSNSFSFGGHYYRTVGKLATYEDAKEMCENNGAYLVEPNTEAENVYVHDKMHEAFYGHWRYIGGSDRESEGNFVWGKSGKRVSYVNWWPGEPNNGGYSGEDCMEMRYWGKWNDVDCSDNNRYICEMDQIKEVVEEKEGCVTDNQETTTESTTTDSTDIPISPSTTEDYYY